jgi:hypothetical protein
MEVHISSRVIFRHEGVFEELSSKRQGTTSETGRQEKNGRKYMGIEPTNRTARKRRFSPRVVQNPAHSLAMTSS